MKYLQRNTQWEANDSSRRLKLESFATSEAGLKTENQDAWAVAIPDNPGVLQHKGAVLAVADGVSACAEAKQASHTSLSSFIADYYSTPDTWTIRHSAAQVIQALNRWLYQQGHHLKGHFAPQEQSSWCTTLTAQIVQSATAHIIHTGDSRAWLYRNGQLECLTTDHKIHMGQQCYLSRALGMNPAIEVDYQTLPLAEEDILILTTDGIHDTLSQQQILNAIIDQPFHQLCQHLTNQALALGSQDNVTVVATKIKQLPLHNRSEHLAQLNALPFHPDLYPGKFFESFEMLEQIHASKRNQLYLARDRENNRQVILKTPSVNYEDDPAYIERFIQEEWIGRRIHHPAIMKVYPPRPNRQFLYHACEYIPGQTLKEWMQDNPSPPLSVVRDIIQQIISAVRCLHRLQILHQDLKPENLIIDQHQRVHIIDLGSAAIKGEATGQFWENSGCHAGTRNYIAPEYFYSPAGKIAIDERADQFAIGVIAYELLAGKPPYRELTAHTLDYRHFQKLTYHPLSQVRPDIPLWVDHAIACATAINPLDRYPALSEFIHDMQTPNPLFQPKPYTPLIEKDPLRIWQVITLVLVLLNLWQLLGD